MKEESFTPNLFPFMVLALAKNKKVHSLIDEFYYVNKNKYDMLAKENYWYNTPVINSYDLITEDYAKKSIGLLKGLSDDEIKSLIKKGWPKYYSWAESADLIIMIDSMTVFMDEIQGGKDDIIYAISVSALTGHLLNKSILIDEESKNNFTTFIDAQALICSNNYNLHHKNLPKALAEACLYFYQDMCSHNRIDNKFHKIWNSDNKKVKFISNYVNNMFNLEDISRDITETIELTNDDFIEIVASYLCGNVPDKLHQLLEAEKKLDSPIDIISATTFLSENMPSKNTEHHLINLIYLVYFRKMLKAYNQAKDYYNKKICQNENNGKLVDSLKAKVVELENQNKNLTNQLAKLQVDYKEIERKLNSKFNKTLYQYTAENKKLNETIEGLKSKINSYKKEIQLLLNLNAAMADELEVETEEIDYDFVNDLNVKGIRGVIVGGHPKWQNMMKGYLPNFKFIGIDDINFDTALLENADAVFINTKYASHSLLYKVISAVKNKNIDIHYINCNNKNYVLNRISDIAC